MSSSWRGLLRLAVSLGLAAAFLYRAFSDLDAEAIWTAMAAVARLWLVAMVAMILVTAVLRAWRWVVLLRPVSADTTILDATLALAICYSVNLVSPSPEPARLSAP